MNQVTRQLAKAITGSPAQTQLKPPAPLSLTRGIIAGVNVIIANVPTTTVQLAGSSLAVPCEVSVGYGAKAGDTVDILVAPPRLIVLGPTSNTGGIGGIPDFKGEGDPNGVQEGPAGTWYENTLDGTLWLSSGSNDTWAELNPGVVTLSFCAGDTVTQVIGFGNMVTINSGLSLALGYDNTITTGESAIAIGENNSVTGQGMAIGASAVANALQAVAIGYAATADNDSQIALGGSSSYVLFGNEYNIFTTSGSDPTGSITPVNSGDICISNPGIWQAATGGDDTSWSAISGGGGGGGGYDSLTGAGESGSPGALTQLGGFTVTDDAGDGVHLDSVSGVILSTNDSSGAEINLAGAEIDMQNANDGGPSSYVRMTGDSVIGFSLYASPDNGSTWNLPINHVSWDQLFIDNIPQSTHNTMLELSSDGTTTAVGFHGATPVPQAGTPTTLADVITILTNLGLCA